MGIGDTVVIDVENERHIQEAQTIIEIPNATTITVAKMVFAHIGTQAPVPILQPSEKGALIAEWNEYTPTSGSDIAVTSNLATIS